MDPSLMLFVLCLFLLTLLLTVGSLVLRLLLKMLKTERMENQKLRNLMLSRDLSTLAGLNQLTGVSQSLPDSPPVEVNEQALLESISAEEELARQGFEIGDLDGLESYGWSAPVTKRDGSSDPIAFE